MKLILLVFLVSSLFASKPELFLLKKYTDDINITSWYMSEKLDGVRAYWDGNQLISRSGKVFNPPRFFTKDFPKHELDGELWTRRGEFDKVSSIVRSKGEGKPSHPKEKLGEGKPSHPKEKLGEGKPSHPKEQLGEGKPFCLKKDGTDGLPSAEMKKENNCQKNKEPMACLRPNEKINSRWKNLKYMIFEVPNAKGNLLERLHVAKETKYIKIIKQIKVKDKQHLQNFLKDIEAKGGEGVVVRDGSLAYYAGRTKNALKVKSYVDEECKVVKHNQGSGKYANKLGSLSCLMDNGLVIKIGSGFSDAGRSEPPKINAIITFKYYGLTSKGKPRFPIFLRERD